MSGLNERTKRRIALLAGDDLEGEDVEEIRRLIASCPDCQRYWIRVRGSLDILERSGSSTEQWKEELWPGMESRLRAAVAPARPPKFNGWVPALSMAAACIAMLVAGQMDATWHQEGNWPTSSEQLAGGFPHSSGWMLISEDIPRSAQLTPFSPPVPRIQSAGYDMGMSPVIERVAWPSWNRKAANELMGRGR